MPISNVNHHEYTFVWTELGISLWSDLVQAGGSCGRAAVCNLIWVTGWASDISEEFASAQEVFDYCDLHLDLDSQDGDATISESNLLSWWWGGDDWGIQESLIDIPGGGGFYPYPGPYWTQYMYALCWSATAIPSVSDAGLMAYIERILNEGRMPWVEIVSPGGATSHALTCWGFRRTKDVYDTIMITDSANLDGSDGLRHYPITLVGGQWVLGATLSGYSDWYIESVRGLKMKALVTP